MTITINIEGIDSLRQQFKEICDPAKMQIVEQSFRRSFDDISNDVARITAAGAGVDYIDLIRQRVAKARPRRIVTAADLERLGIKRLR